jgi:hypothetical protein
MGHMVFRVDHIVSNQLYGFGVDDLGVMGFHHRLHQVLVNQSSKGAPLVAIMHDQQMISLGDEIVRDKGMGPMAVDATLAIEDFFHQSAIGDDGHVAISDLEHVQPAILGGPFGESEDRKTLAVRIPCVFQRIMGRLSNILYMGVLLGDLVDISNEG